MIKRISWDVILRRRPFIRNGAWIITYIHVLKGGWTYLASVMDLCSRKIVGYAYGTSMKAELAVETVKNACLNVRNTQGIPMTMPA